jgi:hypothetical protein
LNRIRLAWNAFSGSGFVRSPARACLSARNLSETADSWRGMRLAMMALTKKSPQLQPQEIEALLPWHAAGTLDAPDTRRVEEALARDLPLREKYAAIGQERAGIVALNEALGAPSPRVVQKLFAAIDAEAVQRQPVSARVGGFLASLSPRALAWSAALAALLLLLQAGVIGALLMRHAGPAERASLSEPEIARLVSRLQNERIISRAAPAW